MTAERRQLLVVRFGLTVVLLAFAWGVRESLEGLSGGIVGSILTYWLPAVEAASQRQGAGARPKV